MNLMRYLLEANLYLVAFYLLYVLLLRRETYYQLSRAYLLVASALAFIIPLLQLGILKPQTETFTSVSMGPKITFGNLQAVHATLAPPLPTAHIWTTFDYFLLAYGTITLGLIINLGVKIFKLVRLSKQNATTSNGDFVMVEIAVENAAFSFFRYLFIDSKLATSATVIHHEQVHIRQKHSWDIVYLEVLKIVNWFNPVIYLLQNSIKEIHEFIADRQTAQMENSNDSYAEFLISNAYGVAQGTLTNSFSNKNMLRKRIIMLYQKRSGRLAALKYMLALPLIGGLLCISTMGFTDKSYGLVDILPQHMKEQLAKFDLRQSFFTRKKDTDQTTIAPLEDESIAALQPDSVARVDSTTDSKNPLYILNGRVLSQAPVTSLDDKGSIGKKVAGIADIDPADIKSISILKDSAATAMYGPAGAHGVVIITTNDYARGRLDAINNDVASALKREITEASKRALLDSNVVYTAVETEPIPANGLDAFYQFLGKNIRYPAIDQKNGTQGRAILQFIVEKDGSLTNIKTMRAPSPTLGDEAVRVLKLAPNWTPGTQNKKAVRVQYTIPVNFSIDSKAESQPIKSQLFTAVEIEPSPKGGLDAFYKFLSDKVKYPEIDKNNGTQGRVITQFIIEKDGSFSDIKVLHAPSPSLGAEAVRVLSISPKWNPGIQNGRTVRVQYAIPINFSLGGLIDFDAFYKQLSAKIKYPKEAKENGFAGRTIVMFSLDDKKQIKDVQVMRGVCKTIDDEVVRAIKNVKQIPGGQTGVVYTIPLNFSIKNKDNGEYFGAPDKDYSPAPYRKDAYAANAIREMLNEVVIVGYK